MWDSTWLRQDSKTCLGLHWSKWPVWLNWGKKAPNKINRDITMYHIRFLTLFRLAEIYWDYTWKKSLILWPQWGALKQMVANTAVSILIKTVECSLTTQVFKNERTMYRLHVHRDYETEMNKSAINTSKNIFHYLSAIHYGLISLRHSLFIYSNIKDTCLPSTLSFHCTHCKM